MLVGGGNRVHHDSIGFQVLKVARRKKSRKERYLVAVLKFKVVTLTKASGSTLNPDKTELYMANGIKWNIYCATQKVILSIPSTGTQLRQWKVRFAIRLRLLLVTVPVGLGLYANKLWSLLLQVQDPSQSISMSIPVSW